MAGLTPVQSMDESYRHSKLNADTTVLETRSVESGPVSDPDGEPYTWVRTSGNGRVSTPLGVTTTALGLTLTSSDSWLAALSGVWQTFTAFSGGNDSSEPKAQGSPRRIDPSPHPRWIRHQWTTKRCRQRRWARRFPTIRQRSMGHSSRAVLMMQDPLQAEESLKAYATPKGLELSIWAKESSENSPILETGKLPV